MAGYADAIKGFTDLVSEWIEDKDLKSKLEFEGKKLEFELDKLLLTTKTTPKTDATIKIMLASRDIVIPMFRPVGAVLLAAFGAYCTTKGIVLPEYVQAMLFGSPLAYGASRHSSKKDEQKTKRVEISKEINWDEI